MQDSKLITTLKLLRKEDIDGVNRLLSSELLIKGSYKKECEALYNFIISCYPDFQTTVLDKENVLEVLFKDDNSKINRLEKAMSALLQVVEYYIIHFVAEQNYTNLRYNLLLSKYYREKELPQRSIPFLLKMESDIKRNNTQLESEYYYWLNQYKEEKISNNQVRNEKISDEQLLEVFYTSFEYSILLSVENLAKTVFLQRRFDENTSQLLLDLGQLIRKNNILYNNILIRLYLLGLCLFETVKAENFYNLLQEFDELFDANYTFFQTETAYNLSAIKRVSIAFRHNYQADNQSIRLVFNNSKKDLEAGFLFVNGFIHSNAASNIVANALKLKENAWVKYFLETYHNNIGFQNESREEILKFCWAQYYFAEREFKKAEEQMNVHHENITYFIATRRVQLKIYFEREEYFVMESELEAFKIYLYRQYKQKQAISEDFFTVNNSFVDALKQIYHLMFNSNVTKKNNLLQKLQEGKYSEQDWLIEKLALIKI